VPPVDQGVCLEGVLEAESKCVRFCETLNRGKVGDSWFGSDLAWGREGELGDEEVLKMWDCLIYQQKGRLTFR
jgi:hypothetical protein